MWTKIKQFVVVPVLAVAYQIHCPHGRAELKLIQLVYGDRGTCIICNCKTQAQQHSHSGLVTQFSFELPMVFEWRETESTEHILRRCALYEGKKK